MDILMNKFNCSRIAACGIGCIVITILLTYMVFLAIFSMLNPDEQAWYGVIEPGDKQALYATREMGKEAGATDLVDIHGRFVTWFYWGFTMSVLPLPIAMVSTFCQILHNRLGKTIAMISFICLGCSYVAWWITGIYWRFNKSGSYASGDIVPEGVTAEKWSEKLYHESGTLF